MKARAAIVLTVTLGGVILLVLVASHRPDLGQQVLPDGTTLTLVAVKAGSKHASPFATLKEKLAARLPASWRSRLKLSPAPATSSQLSSNYLTVWLTAENNSKGPPQFHLLLGDERDNFCSSDDNYSSRRVASQLSSNVWLEGLPVHAWARRTATLRIQVYARWGEKMFWPKYRDKMIAEFRVKYPGRDTTTPPWTALPWPIAVRDGDLDFALTSLWAGLGSFHSYSDHRLTEAKDPTQRSTRATFRVTSGGEVLTNWNAYQVRGIRDATGNLSHGDSFNSLIRDGVTFNQFGQPPPPADEAWQMTVEFSRVSGFSAEELHTVSRVPVQPAGQSLRVASNSLGPDSLEFAWDTRPTEESKPVGVWVTVRPERNDHKLTLVRALECVRLLTSVAKQVPSRS